MSQYFASIFRRRPNEGWFRVGTYDVTTVDLLCSTAVFTMFVYGILGKTRWSELVFVPFLVREDFDLWRLITWSTATEPDFWPLLGIVFFWLWAQEIEGAMGRNRFGIWVATVTVLSASIMTLLGALSTRIDITTAGFGIHLMFLAVIWVDASIRPDARWFGVIPMWGAAAIFTLLNVLRYNGDGFIGMVIFTLLTCAVGLTAAASLGLQMVWPIPHIPLSTGSRSGRSGRTKKSKPKRPKRGGSAPRVVEGPWGTDSGSAMPAPPTGPPAASPADQAELDGLLDKIGAQGMDALSGHEKQRLNELSKRLRNR